MKVCEYCGTEVADDVERCSGCGSSAFRNEGTNSQASLPHESNKSINVQIKTHTAPGTKRKSRVLPILLVLIVLSILYAGLMNSDVKKNGVTDNVKTEVKKELSDVEIVTLPGHPKYYGDFKEAEKLWKGYKKVKVVNAGQSSFYGDALLLITTGNDDWDNDFITSVNFNLHNTESGHELTVDDVLKIVCEYIPYEILEKYYTFDYAFHETNISGGYEAYHYVMLLNEEGRAANKSDDKDYRDKFAFKIAHNDDGWHAEIDLLAYEGNFQRYGLKFYKVEDWVVDINKYK